MHLHTTVGTPNSHSVTEIALHIFMLLTGAILIYGTLAKHPFIFARVQQE